MPEPKWPIKKLACLSLEFCMLWVASNYFYNAGLASTSVSSSTVLSNSSSIFVYLLSLCLIAKTKFSGLRAVIVLLSFAGITIITMTDKADPKAPNDSFKGNVFSLASAVCYGLYAVWLKRKVPKEDEEEFNFSLFLGFVGLFNTILLLPVFLVLNYTGVETFEMPNGEALAYMSLNAVIGTLISDYCWARSVVILGPLLTTMGIGTTIPLSMIVDAL